MNASQRRIRQRVLDRRNEPHLDREVEEEADEIFEVFHERHTGEPATVGEALDQDASKYLDKQAFENQALSHAADSRMADLREVLNKEEPNV